MNSDFFAPLAELAVVVRGGVKRQGPADVVVVSAVERVPTKDGPTVKVGGARVN